MAAARRCARRVRASAAASTGLDWATAGVAPTSAPPSAARLAWAATARRAMAGFATPAPGSRPDPRLRCRGQGNRDRRGRCRTAPPHRAGPAPSRWRWPHPRGSACAGHWSANAHPRRRQGRGGGACHGPSPRWRPRRRAPRTNGAAAPMQGPGWPRPPAWRNRPRQGRASPLVPVARLGWPRRGRRSTGDDSARQGRLAPARAQLAPGEGAASPRRGRGRPPGDGDGGSAPLAAAGLAPGGGGYSSWAVRVSKP